MLLPRLIRKTINQSKSVSLILVALLAVGCGDDVAVFYDDTLDPRTGLPLDPGDGGDGGDGDDCTIEDGSPEALGKELYLSAELQCTLCHGATGTGPIAPIDSSDGYLAADPDGMDFTTLYEVNLYTMPQGNVDACDDTCATQITAYLTLWETCGPI